MLIFLLILLHESVYIGDNSYPGGKNTLISYAVYLRLKLHTHAVTHTIKYTA